MTTLIFRSTKLETITYKGLIWFTSSQLAKALGYANPKAVTMIYNKHYDEFTEAMSLVLKTSTNGINNSLRELNTRIFSLRGAHLVAMFAARTPVAKEFRKRVLDILDKEVSNPKYQPEAHEKFSSKDTQNLASIIALITQNFRFRDAWNNAIWYALRGPFPVETQQTHKTLCSH